MQLKTNNKPLQYSRETFVISTSNFVASSGPVLFRLEQVYFKFIWHKGVVFNAEVWFGADIVIKIF